MYNWKWYLKDIEQDKPVKVFSTFACGGGSSMGYKRAGFDVIGSVEIDPRVNEQYVKNLHPKYNYVMDLRDFNKLEELPAELYHIDILDGSPPCSTFSIAGNREDDWGREKVFTEGQKKQTLDDLFFVFLDTVEKLHPKIVIAENVIGLIKGNARGYVNQILKRFHELGYEVQLFKLNAAYMDVPQARERVFFIANNQGYPKLKLNFNGRPIPFGEIRTEHGNPNMTDAQRDILKHIKQSDRNFAETNLRVYGKYSRFNDKAVWDNEVASTITANGKIYRAYDKTKFSDMDIINASTFPQDYDFCGRKILYTCGMSVPPNMMANIATEIYKQWIEGESPCMKK